MATREKGFTIQVEEDVHRITIRFWGRWTPETGEEYLAECRRRLPSLSDNQESSWTIFLDLTQFTLPPPEVQHWLERGFLSLKDIDIRRQAILLHGPIIHLPDLSSAQTGALVSSYFQSEAEALEWLKESL